MSISGDSFSQFAQQVGAKISQVTTSEGAPKLSAQDKRTVDTLQAVLSDISSGTTPNTPDMMSRVKVSWIQLHNLEGSGSAELKTLLSQVTTKFGEIVHAPAHQATTPARATPDWTGMLEKAQSGTLTLPPALSKKEVVDVIKTLKANWEQIGSAGKLSPERVRHIRPGDVKAQGWQLPRALEIGPNGKLYLLVKGSGTKKLGKGSYKEASYALDLGTMKSYVQATIRLQGSSAAGVFREAMQEIELQMSMPGQGKVGVQHVATYESKAKDGQPSVVKLGVMMELCNLGDMTHVMGSKEQVFTSSGQLVDVMEDLVNSLSDLDAAELHHRDIKPANVFMHRDEASGRITAKVADFGLAKTEEQDQSNPYAWGGSPLYFAPEYGSAIHDLVGLDEQLTGLRERRDALQNGSATNDSPEQYTADLQQWRESKAEATEAATSREGDVWAMGLALFELAVGKRPDFLFGETVRSAYKDMASANSPQEKRDTEKAFFEALAGWAEGLTPEQIEQEIDQAVDSASGPISVMNRDPATRGLAKRLLKQMLIINHEKRATPQQLKATIDAFREGTELFTARQGAVFKEILSGDYSSDQLQQLARLVDHAPHAFVQALIEPDATGVTALDQIEVGSKWAKAVDWLCDKFLDTEQQERVEQKRSSIARRNENPHHQTAMQAVALAEDLPGIPKSALSAELKALRELDGNAVQLDSALGRLMLKVTGLVAEKAATYSSDFEATQAQDIFDSELWLGPNTEAMLEGLEELREPLYQLESKAEQIRSGMSSVEILADDLHVLRNVVSEYNQLL